jgi:hypothetical protein
MSRFPPPWTVGAIAGVFKVLDANGQGIAYVYGVQPLSPLVVSNAVSNDHEFALAVDAMNERWSHLHNAKF